MRTSDIGATDVRSTAMGVSSSSSSSSASKRLWLRASHSWYGSNFGGVRATGKDCAFEHSVPMDGRVLLLPIVLLEAPQRFVVPNERSA